MSTPASPSDLKALETELLREIAGAGDLSALEQARGTMVLNDSDAKIVKKYMPYAR